MTTMTTMTTTTSAISSGHDHRGKGAPVHVHHLMTLCELLVRLAGGILGC